MSTAAKIKQVYEFCTRARITITPEQVRRTTDYDDEQNFIIAGIRSFWNAAAARGRVGKSVEAKTYLYRGTQVPFQEIARIDNEAARDIAIRLGNQGLGALTVSREMERIIRQCDME